MSELIISNSKKTEDIAMFIEDKLNVYGAGILNPRYPGFSESERYEIMLMRYRDEFIADALETGHFTLTRNGDIKINFLMFNQDVSVIAGYIFETFTVREANLGYKSFGKDLFKWCTNRKKLSKKYFEQFQAIGVGFPNSKAVYPEYYNPSLRQFDIMFLMMNKKENKPEPATIVGTSIPAGVQIKAITSNEMTNIINPLLSDQYSKVITYLRHPSGKHSYEVCMEKIKRLYREGEITEEDRYYLEDSIGYPEMFGLNQRDIDDYYYFIKEWYMHRGRTREDDNLFKAIGLQSQEMKYGDSFITAV